MDRSVFPRKGRRIFALFLMFILFPRLHALGGGGEARSFDAAARGDLRSKQIALSLRIAEAKGKESSLAHYRSLLRHNKRKALGRTYDGAFGYFRSR